MFRSFSIHFGPFWTILKSVGGFMDHFQLIFGHFWTIGDIFGQLKQFLVNFVIIFNKFLNNFWHLWTFDVIFNRFFGQFSTYFFLSAPISSISPTIFDLFQKYLVVNYRNRSIYQSLAAITTTKRFSLIFRLAPPPPPPPPLCLMAPLVQSQPATSIEIWIEDLTKS